MNKREIEKQQTVEIAKKNLKWSIKKNSPILCALAHVSSQGAQYYRLYAIAKKHRGMERTHTELVDITDDYAVAVGWPYHITERKHNALFVHSSSGNNIERNLEKMGISVSTRIYL